MISEENNKMCELMKMSKGTGEESREDDNFKVSVHKGQGRRNEFE